MVKVLFKLCVACAITLLSSCSESSNRSSIDYLPVQTEKDSRWGMVNSDGKIIFENEFENKPTIAIDGVFMVNENGGLSLYIVDKKPKLIPNANGLKYAGAYNNGRIPIVREKERISIIDKQGKTKFVLNPVDDKEIVECDFIFVENSLRVMNEDRKVGLIDINGNYILKPQFDYISTPHEDIVIAVNNDDNNQGITGFNLNGKELFKLDKDYKIILDQFRGGRMTIFNNNILGYIDTKGTFTKYPSKFIYVLPINNKYSLFVSEDKKYGIIDNDNKILIRAKYNSIVPLKDNLFLGEINGNQSEIFNINGDILSSFENVEIVAINNYSTSNLNISSKFDMIEEDRDTYSLLKYDGAESYKDIFFGVNLAIFNTDNLKSDYFNINNAIAKLISIVEPDGLWNNKFGEPITKFVNNKEPKDFYLKFNLNLDNKIQGHEFSITDYNLLTSESIALEQQKYREGYDYGQHYNIPDGYSYYWNSDCTVEGFMAQFFIPRQYMKYVLENIKPTLNKKGFKLEKEYKTVDLYLDKTQRISLIIGYDEDSDYMTIYLLRDLIFDLDELYSESSLY